MSPLRVLDVGAGDLSALRPGRRAGWLARRAAVGGGGLGLVGGLTYGVLRVEARLARRLIKPPELPPMADGWYGNRVSGRGALRLAVLGDSAGAGLGADLAEETPGALLAAALALATGRRVHLRVHAVPGAVSADLAGQIDRCLLEDVPDVVVVSIGANDVTHAVPREVATASLRRAVQRLREAGVEVVVGTCPDLGTVRPIAPPLRWVARWRSRRMAAAQAQTVADEGGYPVAIGELLGEQFARTSELFSSDRFHPSSAGYRLLASALLPCLREAAGLPPLDHDDATMVATTKAVEAVKSPTALLVERDEADRLVLRFWRALRDRVGGGPDVDVTDGDDEPRPEGLDAPGVADGRLPTLG